MDEIDHVRGRKTVSIGKMDDIWIDLYAYVDTGCDRLLGMTRSVIDERPKGPIEKRKRN